MMKSLLQMKASAQEKNHMPQGGGSPPLNLKPNSVFFFSLPSQRPDGIPRHYEPLQLEAEWLIGTPVEPRDTGDENGCLPSEAGVVGLNGGKMPSWKGTSTSCPGLSASINTTCSYPDGGKALPSRGASACIHCVEAFVFFHIQNPACVSRGGRGWRGRWGVTDRSLDGDTGFWGMRFKYFLGAGNTCRRE